MAQPFERPVTAIVSLDLYGYSRLTEQDEIGTHRALMACWRQHLQPLVEEHQGFVVKFTGDGAILRFPTAAAALDATTRFQRGVARSKAFCPTSRRLVFRIGLHLGSMIQEQGDIYGHGVNLAVRLQETAEPGSILLSEVAYRQLPEDQAKRLKALGQKRFKNIQERVCVHRWRESGMPDRQIGLFAKAAVLLVPLLAPTAISNGIGPIPNESEVAVHLSKVMPPVEHAALLSAASKTVDPDSEMSGFKPSRGLKAGPLDTFSALAMTPAEQSMRSRLEIAEDAYLQGLAFYNRHTPASFAQAIVELDHGLRFQPEDGKTHALLAAVYWSGLQNHWKLGKGMTRVEMLNRTTAHLASVPDPDPFAHMVTSEMLTLGGHHQQALTEARRAIALNPDLGVGHYALGRALLFAGHAEDAMNSIRSAIRLDPHAPRYLFGLGFAAFSMGRFDEAKRVLARATARNNEDDWSHLLMAATSGFLGMKDEAKDALGRFDRLSVPRRGWFASQIPYVHDWPFQHQRDRERFHQGMVLAGIPKRTWSAAR